MTQFIIRFLVGGTVVSLFAALADMLKPKSFAGLFGAAPSIALATLGLTVIADGKAYASTEARSMIAGAIAFFAYAVVASFLMMRYRMHAKTTAVAAMAVWFAVAAGAWLAVLRF